MSDGSGSGSGRGRGQGRRRSRGRAGRSSRGHKGRRDNRHAGNGSYKSSGKGRGRRRRKGGNRGRSKGGGSKPARAAKSPSNGARRYFTGELNEFELFCAYHLGIRTDGSYKKPSIDAVAKRFDTDPDSIRKALVEMNMDRSRVDRSAFDLSMARLDIEVAPPGIDRVELARTIFQDFLDAGYGVGPVPEAVDKSQSSKAKAD
jgi:hypothetical protein